MFLETRFLRVLPSAPRAFRQLRPALPTQRGDALAGWSSRAGPPLYQRPSYPQLCGEGSPRLALPSAA